ncbi:unnamed protein product, partial [Brassica oleracea var. botrytis]
KSCIISSCIHNLFRAFLIFPSECQSLTRFKQSNP